MRLKNKKQKIKKPRHIGLQWPSHLYSLIQFKSETTHYRNYSYRMKPNDTKNDCFCG